MPDSRARSYLRQLAAQLQPGLIAEPGPTLAVFLQEHVRLPAAETDRRLGAALQAVSPWRIRIDNPYLYGKTRTYRPDIGLHGGAVVVIANLVE